MYTYIPMCVYVTKPKKQLVSREAEEGFEEGSQEGLGNRRGIRDKNRKKNKF